MSGSMGYEGWWHAADGKWYPPGEGPQDDATMPPQPPAVATGSDAGQGLSDGAPGPGWWQALDGKWYPPNDVEGAHTSSPSTLPSSPPAWDNPSSRGASAPHVPSTYALGINVAASAKNRRSLVSVKAGVISGSALLVLIVGATFALAGSKGPSVSHDLGTSVLEGGSANL